MALLRADVSLLQAYDAHDPGNCDKLDANEVPFPLPDWLQAQLTRISGNRYPSANPQVLKELLAHYSGVRSQRITLGNGSDELIRSLIMVSCLGQGRAVLSFEPTFGMYRIVAQTLGVPYVGLVRDPETFHVNLAQLKDQLSSTNVGLIFIASPNSPTGTALTEAEITFFRELPADILVVFDEAYFEFSGQTVVHDLPPNWVVLRTLSKAFRLAAYRVGYGIGHPEIISALERVRLPYNLTLVSQQAAQLVLEHHKELLAVIPELLEQREVLQVALSQRRAQVWPSAGNFLYFRVPNAQQFQRDLQGKGTLIRYSGGGLRVTVGTPAENQRFVERIDQLLG